MITNIGTKKRKTLYNEVLTKERNRTDRGDESDSITTIPVTKEPRGQRHSKMAASASRKSNHGFGQPYLFGMPFFSQVGVTKNNSRKHCLINFALVIFKKYR